MILKAIVVVDRNWAIGCKGQLLIHVPEDLKHFKERTWGTIVLYGKNTLTSFPKSKPLPGRDNWILSSVLAQNKDYVAALAGTHLLATLEDLFASLKTLPKEKVVWLIGGAQLYQTLLPYCQEVVVTELDYEAPSADVYFPKLSNNEQWILVAKGDQQTSQQSGISFRINIYKQKKVMRLEDGE